MTELAGAHAVILGLAASGEAAARALLAAGAEVRVLDAADGPAQRARAGRLDGATVVLGRTDPADVAGADLVVASPGVPWDAPWPSAARGAGVPVWSEIELAFRLGIEPAIAITGTNGKTTATEMTVAALTAAGIEAVAAGNSFSPLLETEPGPAIVAEVSSFHLQGIERFRTPVAVLLNLAADHLDWHGSFEAYGRAKARIVENQTERDTVIVRGDPLCGTIVAAARSRRVAFLATSVPLGGAGVEDGWIIVPEGRVVEVEALAPRGRGLLEDAVAAAAAACALGADPSAVGAGLAAYRPRAHRVETIATIDDVTYINDSKSTDPHATLAALESRRDVVLIAGGRNKGLDLKEMTQAGDAVRAVIAIGEAAAEVEAAFESVGVPVEHAGTMEEAVRRASALARPGDTVLLSPGCASWDMFDGYEARGEAFRSAVERLGGSGT